jgi:hypothetical protein
MSQKQTFPFSRREEKEQNKAVIQDGLLKIYPFTIYHVLSLSSFFPHIPVMQPTDQRQFN